MSLWNKILVGLVSVAALVFFYMAARTLKTQQHWRELADKFEKKLTTVQQRNRLLVEADKGELEDGSLGIERSQAELNRTLVNRGRIWEKCDPKKIDSRTGQVAVDTDPATPHRISDKMVLYVFEDTEGLKGGHYLGEFKVTAVADNSIVLAPTMKFSDRELKRLAGSRGPWLLYEVMPVDSHEYLADLSEDEKKAALPPQSAAEYLKDGQPAEPNDPASCKVDGKYQRRLRDYKELFRICRVEQTMYIDIVEGLVRDEQYLKDALADADLQRQAAERKVSVLRADFAVANKERQSVASFQASLERRLAGIQQIVAQRIKENLALAAEIAKIQLDAARRIDQRTQTMAQAGAGNR